MTDFLAKASNDINNFNVVMKSTDTHTHTHTHTHTYIKGMRRKVNNSQRNDWDGFIRDWDIWIKSQRMEMLSYCH
mgnify:CR=1 FL=1